MTGISKELIFHLLLTENIFSAILEWREQLELDYMALIENTHSNLSQAKKSMLLVRYITCYDTLIQSRLLISY